MKTIEYKGKKYVEVHVDHNTCVECIFNIHYPCPGSEDIATCYEDSIVFREVNLPSNKDIVAEFADVVRFITKADEYILVEECVWSALKAMKENSELSISEALNIGLREWDI